MTCLHNRPHSKMPNSELKHFHLINIVSTFLLMSFGLLVSIYLEQFFWHFLTSLLQLSTHISSYKHLDRHNYQLEERLKSLRNLICYDGTPNFDYFPLWQVLCPKRLLLAYFFSDFPFTSRISLALRIRTLIWAV